MGCVFYRCRQGYIKNHSFSSSTPPDLSRFIETDSNSFLYICMGPAFQMGSYNYTDFVNTMELYYPNYNAATPVETGFDRYNEIIHFWAPGFNSGNEGYEEAVRGGLVVQNSDARVWIVPGLKRVIMANGGWNPPYYCWKYENDAITGSRLIMPTDLFLYAGNQTLGFTPCDGSTAEDLRNRDKWIRKYYYLTPNTDSYTTTRTIYSNSNNILQNYLTNLFGDADEPEQVQADDADPYDPGGETEPGGGTGDFDDDSDEIEFPDDPALSAVDTGFLTLFNPSLSQLNDLANFMWGSIFDVENWKKIFANPMDAILGLSMVPVSVPNGGTGTVKVGNIDTGVSMTKAAKQFVNVDCGTINVKEYWGAYLDYSPFTKAEIFLPFIGTHMINIDDIMGKAVHVKYKVDILSGACVVNIKCGGAILYSYSGQCAATIPITGRDWTQTLSSALSVAGNVLSVAASQGMTAPMSAANIAQSAVNAIKPNIQKTGNISGMAGIMGIQKPYIILTRPRQALPKKQNTYTGYPSFITAKLSKCDGYTEVEKIHLDSTSATQDEIKEIETLLDKGVIF